MPLKKKRILLLLWHPKTVALSSGGLVRIKEFLKETPEDFIIDVVDSYPTIFKNDQINGEIHQYRISGFIRYFEKRCFLLERFLEGLAAFWSLIKQGLSLNKSKRYDIFYLPTGETFTVFAAIVLHKLCKVKVAVDSLNIEIPSGSWRKYYKQLRASGYSLLHAFLLPTYIYFGVPILISCFNKVDYVVTVSEYLMKKLRMLGVKTPLNFTPSGIDYSYFAGFPQQEKIYDGIFIGRHETAKGIFDLINVWKIVNQSLPQAKLLMVGYCDSSTKRVILGKIKENNLEGKVILVGEVSEEDKARSLKQSKVYIHLAATEPLFPVISILEGFACGLPLVGYDAPAYQDIGEIRNDKIISLVAAGNYQKAALQIIKYLQLEPSEIEAISYRAQEYAKGFDWKKIAEKQFNILRSVAGKVNH